MIDTINHTGLTVRSVETSLTFYRDLLGMEVDESRSGNWCGPFLQLLTGYEGCSLRIAMVVGADGSRLQLEQFVTPTLDASAPQWASPGGGHVCLEVRDIHAIAEKLRAAGCRLLSVPPEPVSLPAESVNAGGYMMGVLDPDGHVVELLQVPDRAASR